MGHVIDGTNQNVELNNPVVYQSEYENLKDEMDSPVRTDEEDSNFLKSPKSPLGWMIKLTLRS